MAPATEKTEEAPVWSSSMELSPEDLEFFKTECDVYAADQVDTCISSAFDELYDRYILSRRKHFAVKKAIKHLEELVQLAFIAPNEIDPSTWVDSVNEPAPAVIDSWARGVVPSKKRPPKPAAFRENSITTPSDSGRSTTARSVKSRRRTAKSKDSFDSKNGKRKKYDYIIPIEGEEGEVDTETKQKPSSRNNLKAQKSHDNSALQALLEIEERERAIQEKREKRLAEEKAEETRAKELEKQLQGKDYTFDHEGNIILINHVQGDKLPSNVYEPHHSIVPLTEEEPKKSISSSSSEEKEKEKQTRRESMLEGKEKKPKETSANNKFYKSSISFQQRVLKNPSLEVQPGVKFREGDQNRSGPKPEDDPKHMTREKFQQHQTMLESKSISVVTSGIPKNASTTNETSSPIHEEQPASAPPPEEVVEDSTDKFPDEPKSDVDDPNLKLVNSPDWGNNPAQAKEFYPALRPTQKITESKPEISVGPDLSVTVKNTRKPRERPYIEASSPENKKHIPASLGQVSPTNKQSISSPVQNNPPKLSKEQKKDEGELIIKSDRAKRLLGI